MPIDSDLSAALTAASVKSATAYGDTAVQNLIAANQLGLLIASANAYDTRVLGNVVANTLFNQDVVQAKTAAITPITGGPYPLVTAPPNQPAAT